MVSYVLSCRSALEQVPSSRSQVAGEGKAADHSHCEVPGARVDGGEVGIAKRLTVLTGNQPQRPLSPITMATGSCVLALLG